MVYETREEVCFPDVEGKVGVGEEGRARNTMGIPFDMALVIGRTIRVLLKIGASVHKKLLVIPESIMVLLLTG